MSLGQSTFSPWQLPRQLSGWMWRLEHAFERARASGRAEDDTRIRIFFLLALFSLGFVVLALIVLGGVWLMDEMLRISKLEDCAMAGRRNCGTVIQAPDRR